MAMIKDILKWSVILCVAAILLYFIFPKYKFMGPNDFAVFRCNTITGEILAWDVDAKIWVTPSRKEMHVYFAFKRD
jgi:hypothetical protein